MKWLVILSFLLAACSSSTSQSMEQDTATEPADKPPTDGSVANVTAVEVSGTPGEYSFAVTIASADRSCEQYANWWEVVRPDGTLLYRRILGHSHADEQPFTRSGGPVAIQPDDRVIVRAHMHDAAAGGYGGAAMAGSPSVGFEADAAIDGEWHADLSSAQPQPDGCAF